MDSPRPLIVIVEDDDSLGRALDRLLGAAGFETRRFLNAESFLAAPESLPIACLLLDVHLPGVDGFEVLECLHRRRDPPDFPVVLMSADDSEATRRRSARSPAFGFLAKPVEFPLLLRTLQNGLQRQPFVVS